MNVKVWITYEKSYLPKQCKKLRFCECEEFINAKLSEIDSGKLQLAFEDNSYDGKGKIYYYDGKLWSKFKCNRGLIKDFYDRGIEIKTALDYFLYTRENCSTYFYSEYDRKYRGVDTSRQAVIRRVEEDFKSYILVDNELYEITEEPRYVVNTFGLGHNHGGTALFCEYCYNRNIGNQNYFSALDGDKAVAYANEVAKRRGDTYWVGKFEPFIVVHMPKLVKVKPIEEHGSGDKFKNDMEEIISDSPDILTAGLLCIANAIECGGRKER